LDKESIVATLLRRLDAVTGLDETDIAAIRALPIIVRSWEAGRGIVSDGDRPTECCLVIEGFCVRSKTTMNGQRQILSIHIPGDIPDLQSLYLHRMDHDLISLVPSRLGFISHAALRAMTRGNPNITEVLWRDTLIDAAMFRNGLSMSGNGRPRAGLHTSSLNCAHASPSRATRNQARSRCLSRRSRLARRWA
jgi:CRP-like cAMP-binding protein